MNSKKILAFIFEVFEWSEVQLLSRVGFVAFLSERPLLVGEVASVGHVLGEDLPGAVPGRAQRLSSLDILLLQRAQQQGVGALNICVR